MTGQGDNGPASLKSVPPGEQGLCDRHHVPVDWQPMEDARQFMTNSRFITACTRLFSNGRSGGSSGSFATLAAMRRASSRVSGLHSLSCDLCYDPTLPARACVDHAHGW
jgi:hypothetical protein